MSTIKELLYISSIICKAKRLDKENEWVVGYLYKLDISGYETSFKIMPLYASSEYGFPIDAETICRCTGISKDNIFLFENDIIKGKFHLLGGYRKRKGFIKWNQNGAFKVKVKDESDLKNIPDDFEIIGNMFDMEF